MRYCAYDDKDAYDKWHREYNVTPKTVLVGSYYITEEEFKEFEDRRIANEKRIAYEPFQDSKIWYLSGKTALKKLKDDRPYDKRIPIAEVCMLSGLKKLLKEVSILKSKNWVWEGVDVEWNDFIIDDKIFDIIDEMIKKSIAGMEPDDSKVEKCEDLISWCRDSIKSHDRALSEFKSGKDSAINAFKGEIMKKSSGKYSPKLVDETLRSVIKEF